MQKTLVSADPAVQKTDLYCTPENNSLKRRARATRKHEARTVMAATDVQPDQSANWRRSSLSQGRPIHVGSGVRRLRGACLQDWGRETALSYSGPTRAKCGKLTGLPAKNGEG